MKHPISAPLLPSLSLGCTLLSIQCMLTTARTVLIMLSHLPFYIQHTHTYAHTHARAHMPMHTHVRARTGYVEVEKVVSGEGIANLYKWPV